MKNLNRLWSFLNKSFVIYVITLVLTTTVITYFKTLTNMEISFVPTFLSVLGGIFIAFVIYFTRAINKIKNEQSIILYLVEFRMRYTYGKDSIYRTDENNPNKQRQMSYAELIAIEKDAITKYFNKKWGNKKFPKEIEDTILNLNP